MSEGTDIRLHRARSWLRKAGRAEMSGDLDAQFMFLWIAFNSLYGTPRYRDNASAGEAADFKAFLSAADAMPDRRLADALKRVERHAAAVLDSPFLDIDCWRRWDERGIRERGARIAGAIPVHRKEPRVVRLFRQLYTLRNQILHGAATDTGRRNRESLEHAIPVLAACLPVFIAFMKERGDGIPTLQAVPYAPSSGDGGRFNAPRLT